mgnify:CR=1 FL=1
MISVLEERGFFEIRSTLPIGKRILFVLAGLIPLLAPYELIIRPNWQGYLNIPFFFVLIVSIGALLVSALLFWGAIAGLNSRLRLDRISQTAFHSINAPILPWQTRQYPLSAIRSIDVEEREWSEGEPTYSIVASLVDGTKLKAGVSFSREEMQAIAGRASAFIRT